MYDAQTIGWVFEHRWVMCKKHPWMSRMHGMHAHIKLALPDLVGNLLSSKEACAHISIPSSSPDNCTALYVDELWDVPVTVHVAECTCGVSDDDMQNQKTASLSNITHRYACCVLLAVSLCL